MALMDDELNVTDIKLGGFVEMDKYRYLYFLTLFAVYILIICSNSTIVCLICTHKNLHEPMYVFIAALLLNCVLYSTVVYPKLLTDFLSKEQIISYPACLFQFFAFYSLAGSEFLLLTAMAYDRYVSICKPLQYPTIMTKNVVTVFLVLCWILPPSHMAVLTTLSAKAKHCNSNLNSVFCDNEVYSLQCVESRIIHIFGVVSLLDLAILPLLFIVFTYARILVISYRSCKEVRRKAAETCLPHLLVLISLSFLIVYDVSMARVDADFPKTARLIMTLQILLYHPLFNPFIYGFKMKAIFQHLKMLLCKNQTIKTNF